MHTLHSAVRIMYTRARSSIFDVLSNKGDVSSVSSVYLLLHNVRASHNLPEVAQNASSWLPFTPETHCVASTPPWMRLDVWSTFDEAARGAYVHDVPGVGTLAFNGWVVEPTPDPSKSIAESLHSWLSAQRNARSIESVEGDFSALWIDPDGEVTTYSSGLCGQHIYYGQHRGLIAVSNRAALVSAALSGGSMMALRPEFFAWFLSRLYAPLGRGTPWDRTLLLPPEERLSLNRDGIRLHACSLRNRPHVPASTPWSAHYAKFCARSASIQHLPVPIDMALTGGKDSRTVLASLLRANVTSHVDQFYLRADPSHPDTIVAQSLAQHLDLPFTLHPPNPPGPAVPFLERLQTHTFLTEGSLHAWDLKYYTERPRRAAIHGNYGEIFKSHALSMQAGGWPVIRQYYQSRGYLDPHKLLTPQARNYTRHTLNRWLEETYCDGWEPMRVNDRLHRHARMQRWVGHTLMADACGSVSINPMYGDDLLDRYLTMPLKDRYFHRTHLELLRAHDDWLWRQPFARDTWSPVLVPQRWKLPKPVQGSSNAPTRAWTDWDLFGRELLAFLERPSSSAFFDIVDRDALLQHTKHLHSNRPTHRQLHTTYGLCGVRYALEQPFVPTPIRVTSAPLENPHA